MHFKMNIPIRFRHKTFWVSLISALILLAQQLGLHIFPDNTMDIANTIFTILTILGIFVDPTTPSIGDSQQVLEKENNINK